MTPDIFDIIKDTKPGKGGEIQITDAAKTALVEITGGDCRKLENIMQKASSKSKRPTSSGSSLNSLANELEKNLLKNFSR